MRAAGVSAGQPSCAPLVSTPVTAVTALTLPSSRISAAAAQPGVRSRGSLASSVSLDQSLCSGLSLELAAPSSGADPHYERIPAEYARRSPYARHPYDSLRRSTVGGVRERRGHHVPVLGLQAERYLHEVTSPPARHPADVSRHYPHPPVSSYPAPAAPMSASLNAIRPPPAQLPSGARVQQHLPITSDSHQVPTTAPAVHQVPIGAHPHHIATGQQVPTSTHASYLPARDHRMPVSDHVRPGAPPAEVHTPREHAHLQAPDTRHQLPPSEQASAFSRPRQTRPSAHQAVRERTIEPAAMRNSDRTHQKRRDPQRARRDNRSFPVDNYILNSSAHQSAQQHLNNPATAAVTMPTAVVTSPTATSQTFAPLAAPRAHATGANTMSHSQATGQSANQALPMTSFMPGDRSRPITGVNGAADTSRASDTVSVEPTAQTRGPAQPQTRGPAQPQPRGPAQPPAESPTQFVIFNNHMDTGRLEGSVI